MRILWLNHRDQKHPQAGGAEVHLREVGRRLVKMGHEVTLLSERFNGCSEEEVVDGINVKRIGSKYSIHLAAPLFVRKKAKEYDVVVDDIAHAVPWYSSLVTDKPVVGIVHHVHQKVIPLEVAFPLSLAVKAAEKTIKHFYKNIIAVSKATVEDLKNSLDVPENRISLIYYGVDHETYKPNPETEKFDEPTILWLGRIKKYKNLDHLLMAFSLIKKKLPNARLMIAGSGNYERNIKEFTWNLGVDDVFFCGSVYGESKINLLRKSWVLAMTSVIEGWGMSILEASACQTPCVGYNAGALPEAIIDGKTGFLVEYDCDCTDELADRLYAILVDEELRNKLSKGALEYSYNFDWNKTTEETLNVFNQVI